MEERTRRKVLFVGSAFVALMFVFSYLGVSGVAPNSTTTATTTVKPQQTFFASGSANATIIGYASTATLTISSNSPDVANTVASTLSAMRNNGTIQNYISNGQGYDVILGGTGAYSLQQLLFGQLNSTNAIVMTSTANARLGSRVTMSVAGQNVPVQINGTYQLNFTPLVPVNSLVGVTVQALLTQNALVYNNQVTVSYRH